MIGRFAAVVLVFSWLPDCKGAGEPGLLREVCLDPGQLKEGSRSSGGDVCRGHDGKRFWLEGYLQLPTNIEISKGRTRLYFYERIDGNGRGVAVDQQRRSPPGNIEDLWRPRQARSTSAAGQRPDRRGPLRIRTTNGA